MLVLSSLTLGLNVIDQIQKVKLELLLDILNFWEDMMADEFGPVPFANTGPLKVPGNNKIKRLSRIRTG